MDQGLFAIVLAGVQFAPEAPLTQQEVIAFSICSEAMREPKPMSATREEIQHGLNLNRERYCHGGDDAFIRLMVRDGAPTCPLGAAILNHLVRWARARNREKESGPD